MSNRIIKESVCSSETIDRLSWFEEVFFYRLLVNCDDFGRFDARPAILKSRLFPLKDGITVTTIDSALQKLSAVGLVTLYAVEGKPLLQLATWQDHQRIRNQRPKYPAPPPSDASCQQAAVNCPPESESESQSESESHKDSCGKPVQPLPPVIRIPLNDGTGYDVTQDQINKWEELYQNVDILQELRKMVGWCDSHPKQRKTKAGVLRFITGWLAREQDQHHPAQSCKSTGKPLQSCGSSIDLEEYQDMVQKYVPVYKKGTV